MSILSREKALQKAQQYARYGSTHPSYLEWRKLHLENERFYDGTCQWLEDDLTALRGRKEVPLTLNVVAGIIDSQCGIETQSRYRCVVSVDERGTEARQLGMALTKQILTFQEMNDVPTQGSLKFRDACVGGLGWSNIFFEEGKIRYLREDPLNIIGDFDDISPQFTQSRFAIKLHWLYEDQLREKFGAKVKGINFDDAELGFNFFSSELAYRESVSPPSFLTIGAPKTPLWEVQFKHPTKAYGGLSKQGRYFCTFNSDHAEEIAHSSSEIEEFKADQILRVVFLDDTVLHYAPLPSAYPFQTDFSLIPLVWKKRVIDNVPYGMIEPLKAPQMDLNARITKAIYSINSNKIIINGQLPQGMTVEKIKKELSERNSVINLPENVKVQFEKGIVLGEENIKVVQFYIDMMKRISGIHDEIMGAKSNATSGIAEKLRQDSSIRNSAFAFSNFEHMKKREATQYLSTLQNSFLENLVVLGASEEDKEPLILNMVTETISGEPVIYNDINFLPFNVIIDEVPNFKSNRQYQKEEMISLLSNPHADIIMMTPAFLEKITDNAQEISEGFRQAMMQKAQIEAGVQSQQGQSAQPQQTVNPIPQGA